jgi:hypothetical protein
MIANIVSEDDTYRWTITDLQFDAFDFAPYNTVKAITMTDLHIDGGFYQTNSNSTFERLTFRNVRHAFYLDRVTNIKIRNINALDNTTMWVGDTTGGSRSWNVTVDDYTQHFANRPLPDLAATMPNGTALITYQRVIGGSIRGFKTMGSSLEYTGIALLGHDESIDVTDCNIVGVGRGILLDTDSNGGAPTWTRIINPAVDHFKYAGIDLQYGVFTNIIGGSISQNDGGAATTGAGVYVAAVSEGTNIAGNTFQAFHGSQSAIRFQVGARNFSITGNYFTNVAPSVDIDHPGGDYFAVVGNTWSQTGTSTPFSAGMSGGYYKTITGNTGPGINAAAWIPQSIEYGRPGVNFSVDVHTLHPDYDVRETYSGGDATTAGLGVKTYSLRRMTLLGALQLGVYTAATLPTSGAAAGDAIWCSDCNASCAAGGSDKLAIWNGSAWVCK